jgi:hypothetical protein
MLNMTRKSFSVLMVAEDSKCLQVWIYKLVVFLHKLFANEEGHSSRNGLR